MKLAVCFCGQPRFVEEVSPLIKDNVFDNYDVDVFAHLWFDEELQTQPYKYGGAGGWKDQRIPKNSIEKFKEIYSPVKFLVEPSRKFFDSNYSDNYLPTLKRYKQGAINNPDEPDYPKRDVNNILSYYYSLNQVCLLKKTHEFENNFRYDYVIWLRTDSEVRNSIEYESFDKNILYYTGINNQPDGMICDWFNFGGSKVMDAFMGTFPVIDLCIDNCMKQTNGAWCSELIHTQMLKVFNIQSEPLPIYVTLPRF